MIPAGQAASAGTGTSSRPGRADERPSTARHAPAPSGSGKGRSSRQTDGGWPIIRPDPGGPRHGARPSGTGTSPEQGSAWLRRVLNQAAQTAKRSPEFAAAYAAIAQRRGTKIATIAIARKLPTRAWHLLAEMQATQTSTPPRRP